MMLEKFLAHKLHRFMDAKMKKIVLFMFVFVFLLSINIAIAQESIKIIKEGPSNVKFGDIITIKITVVNEFDKEVKVLLRELVVDAEVIEPKLIIPEIPKDIIAARQPYLEWDLVVSPNSNKVVEYKIKPSAIGEYNTGATSGIYSRNEIYSNDLSIIVSCNENDMCESELQENYQNCQTDCPSGSEDNLCDLIKDEKCDPDCDKDVDIDCKTQLSFWQRLINWLISLFK